MAINKCYINKFQYNFNIKMSEDNHHKQIDSNSNSKASPSVDKELLK
jgi:hypothetical protein